ncbi:MAG: glycosyltransferase family 2 protein [Deltaproteobacteria bacterium]|nr:glycosyltransferase family 2 protein [Deltaproteobacteria bacterium]
MRVLCCLLNYKTPDMTLQSLDTLLPEVRAVTAAGKGEARVIIVDNDSKDGSLEKLQAGVDQRGVGDIVTVMPSGHNGGYGYGNNVALRRGLAQDKAQYLYLLNSDAFVEGTALQTMVQYLDQNADVGIAGGYIHGTDGAPHPGVFRYPSIWSEIEGSVRFAPLSRLLEDKVVARPVPAETTTERVEWVPGASMVMRATMLQQIGLFDETFFLYFEETDLCHRAKKAGWKIAFVHDASVAHIVGVSTGVKNLKRRTPGYMLDSRRHYFLKHHGRAYLWASNLAFAAGLASFRVRRKLQNKAEQDYESALTDFVVHCIKNP